MFIIFHGEFQNYYRWYYGRYDITGDFYVKNEESSSRVKADEAHFYARDYPSQFQEAKQEEETASRTLSAVWPGRKISVIFHTPSKCHVHTRACSCVRETHRHVHTRVSHTSLSRGARPCSRLLPLLARRPVFLLFFRVSLLLSLNCFPQERRWALVFPSPFPGTGTYLLMSPIVSHFLNTKCKKRANERGGCKLLKIFKPVLKLDL